MSSKVSRARVAESSGENHKRGRVEMLTCSVCCRETVVFMGTDKCEHFVCSSCHYGIANSPNPDKCPECNAQVVWSRNKLADKLANVSSEEIDVKIRIEQRLAGAFRELDFDWRLYFKNLDARTIVGIIEQLDRASSDEKSAVGVFRNLNGVICSVDYSIVMEARPKFYAAQGGWFEINHENLDVGCVCVKGGHGQLYKTFFLRKNGATFSDSSVIPVHLRDKVRFFENVSSPHLSVAVVPAAVAVQAIHLDGEE